MEGGLYYGGLPVFLQWENDWYALLSLEFLVPVAYIEVGRPDSEMLFQFNHIK